MSPRTDGHDLRCERSQTDPRRCTCKDCRGSKHGIAAVRERHGFETADQPEKTEQP